MNHLVGKYNGSRENLKRTLVWHYYPTFYFAYQADVADLRMTCPEAWITQWVRRFGLCAGRRDHMLPSSQYIFPWLPDTPPSPWWYLGVWYTGHICSIPQYHRERLLLPEWMCGMIPSSSYLPLMCWHDTLFLISSLDVLIFLLTPLDVLV